MKLRHIIMACLLALLACLWARACRVDAKYRQAKLEYAGYRAIAEADHAMGQARIAEMSTRLDTMGKEAEAKDAKIAQHVGTIATLRGELAGSNAATEALRTEVQPVLDGNPKVAELVASLDAGILLRDRLIADQDGLIFTLKERVRLADDRLAVQAKISEEWKLAYEREASLRLKAEALFKLGERRVGANRLAKNIALAVAGAGVAYGLLK